MAGFIWWRVDAAFMSRHALVSLPAVREGRPYTLLTSAFSQVPAALFAGMWLMIALRAGSFPRGTLPLKRREMLPSSTLDSGRQPCSRGCVACRYTSVIGLVPLLPELPPFTRLSNAAFNAAFCCLSDVGSVKRVYRVVPGPVASAERITLFVWQPHDMPAGGSLLISLPCADARQEWM